MCGITGILSLQPPLDDETRSKVKVSCHKILQRGPDGGAIFADERVALGHRRLSIIDTSAAGNQPMTDPSGRYTIAYNGEIFNYRELKEQYFPGKNDWHSHSDTEVLLHLFIQLREKCLPLLHGFFALAVYDAVTGDLFLARDRYGKKPLLYTQTDTFFAFASEMKALLAYDIPKEINYTVLLQYLQLNYIPQPQSIFKGVHKLEPGHYLNVSKDNISKDKYYELRWNHTTAHKPGYTEAEEQLVQLMDASVQKRLISDVPLGAFLSGGIDSSVVVALASRHTPHLNTFSVGYRDNSFFDETDYANMVAKKYATNHTVFSLTNNDFLEHVDDILRYIDEPFADSSAIPVYILSMHTRKHVTVALSGDGGDEVFAGYNKHRAEWRMRRQGLLSNLVKMGAPVWKMLPRSRNSKTLNIFRQLHRYAEGARMNARDRYWQWAGFQDRETALAMLSPAVRAQVDMQEYEAAREHILRHLKGGEVLEDFLATDMELVLQSDMLVKVDLMSMANGLEIRSPFLDHEVVDYAFSLPTVYKINGSMTKRIVQDAFRDFLPEAIYNRPKHGFEIPLLDWFRKELRSLITDDLLEPSFIEEQGIFDPGAVNRLTTQLFSANPGDAHATTWALVVFQSWWKEYYNT